MARCPGCKSQVKPRGENAAFPFCSARCKAIDLGRWVTGSYRVPGEPASQDEARPPAAADDDQKQ